MRLLPGFLAVTLLAVTLVANGESISRTDNGSCSINNDSLVAADEVNGFDVVGNINVTGAGCVVSWTTTANMTLSSGSYETHIALAGTGQATPGTFTLTTSTRLETTASILVAGSLAQSAGTDTNNDHNDNSSPVDVPFDGQPANTDSGKFSISGGTYVLTQVMELDLPGSGSPNINIDFTDPNSTITSAGVPEPTTFVLLGAGIGLVAYRRLRRRA